MQTADAGVVPEVVGVAGTFERVLAGAVLRHQLVRMVHVVMLMLMLMMLMVMVVVVMLLLLWLLLLLLKTAEKTLLPVQLRMLMNVLLMVDAIDTGCAARRRGTLRQEGQLSGRLVALHRAAGVRRRLGQDRRRAARHFGRRSLRTRQRSAFLVNHVAAAAIVAVVASARRLIRRRRDGRSVVLLTDGDVMVVMVVLVAVLR